MRAWYEHWNCPAAVDRFAHKTGTDFFASEIRLLDRIRGPLASVFDVGCASGRFRQLVRERWPEARYAGIDLSSASINNARRLYPDCEFIVGNALNHPLDDAFDLVNATGVFQHEPAWEVLLERMLAWSSRYTLFDVKLAALEDHLADRELAYCAHEPPIYFIVLSFPRLRERIEALSGIARAHVYGYVTPTNGVTVVPEAISPIVSAGVLLEHGRSRGAAAIDITLPDSVVERVRG